MISHGRFISMISHGWFISMISHESHTISDIKTYYINDLYPWYLTDQMKCRTLYKSFISMISYGLNKMLDII